LPTSSARIKVYKKQISGSAQRAFFLGAFVAMAEFPFTGALYLALLSLLSLTSLTFDSLFLLLAYNLIFVSPLITTLYFFWQKKPDIIKKWTRKHKKFLSAIMGLALSLFGIWLIWLALF
jgi:cytochrome c biogenesis protein CcdA